MKKSKIDISVLIIFFARPENLEKVFEEVRKARPTKLFLYQDGPREGNKNDLKKIKECREIVEKIDWECDTYKLYQEKNFGCDPSEYIAIKWFFNNVKKGIILEDDDIPSQGFFPFCKDLLDKYENNPKIHMICGMNNLDELKNTKESYIFSKYGSIWGWATWKRCVDSWDENYKFLENNLEIKKIESYLNNKEVYEKIVDTCKKHKESGKAHYETINGVSQYINNRINIVPTKNMITNIGIGEDTTHSTNNIKKLPKVIQKLFFKKRFEIKGKLIHPLKIEINEKFEKDYEKLMFPNKIEKNRRKLESFFRKKIYK